MIHVSCRLTAKNRDQLRNPTLGNRVWATFTFFTRVSRYQKDKTNLDFTEARDSEWQWHQLGHMQVCISLQTDNRTSTPPDRMPFLPPNQQRKITEGNLVNV